MLAQAGEGSVRDSLSALDQAIACCGNKLEAAEVRGLLGMFSLESLEPDRQALARRRFAADAGSGGGAGSQRTQPAAFRRELARYFRNLLVVKIARKDNAAGRRIARRAGQAGGNCRAV